MNGYANGHAPPELQQDTSFLFTSESVGEGHPGERSTGITHGTTNPFAGPRVALHYRSVNLSLRLSFSFSLRSTSPCTLRLSHHHLRHYHHRAVYAAMEEDRHRDPGRVPRFFPTLPFSPPEQISIDANCVFPPAGTNGRESRPGKKESRRSASRANGPQKASFLADTATWPCALPRRAVPRRRHVLVADRSAIGANRRRTPVCVVSEFGSTWPRTRPGWMDPFHLRDAFARNFRVSRFRWRKFAPKYMYRETHKMDWKWDLLFR